MADSEDKTVLESIKENFEGLFMDRLSSPLIFSFILSWCVTNYQFFLILFSDSKFFYKVQLFNWYFYSPWYYWILYSVIWPAVVAYLYVYQWPKFNIKVIEHSLKTKNAENALRNKIAGNELRTVEEVNRIHANHSKIVRKLNAEIKRLNEIETQLTAELETRDAEQEEEIHFLRNDKDGFVATDLDFEDESPFLEPEFTDTQQIVIKMLGDAENHGREWVGLDDIQKKLKLDIIHTKVLLTNLMRNSIITSSSSGGAYKLQPDGHVAFTKITANAKNQNKPSDKETS